MDSQPDHRPPEPMMPLYVARKPGGKPVEVLVDEATAEQLQRDLTVALQGIRAAKAAVAAMLIPRGQHPYPLPAISPDKQLPPCALCGRPSASHGISARDDDEHGCHAWRPATGMAMDHPDAAHRRSWRPAPDDPTITPDKAADPRQCPAGLLRIWEDWGAACRKDAGHEPPHDGQDGEWDDDHPRHVPDLDARFATEAGAVSATPAGGAA